MVDVPEDVDRAEALQLLGFRPDVAAEIWARHWQAVQEHPDGAKNVRKRAVTWAWTGMGLDGHGPGREHKCVRGPAGSIPAVPEHLQHRQQDASGALPMDERRATGNGPICATTPSYRTGLATA
ncbi:MAG: hypothetical protein M1826_000695 [Phylliscum demangeonii]|nr:MAG: hypothetical protein M1826_000695 [Phylliscum demangeonii]